MMILKNTLSLFLSLLLSFSAYSQKVSVESAVENIAGGINNVYKVTIPHANAKMVEKKWNTLLKQHKAKVRESKGVIKGENMVIPAMGSDSLQVYTRIKEEEGMVVMIVAVDQNGVFMNAATSPSDNKKMEEILHNFGVELGQDGINAKLEDAQDVLANKNKEKKDLSSVVDQLSRDNERMKKAISDNEQQIKANNNRLEGLEKEIENQQSAIEAIKAKTKEL